MFGKKRKEQAKQRRRDEREKQFKLREAEGADLFKRLAQLRQLDKSRLSEAVKLLLRDAQHQRTLVYQSIVDRTGYKSYDFGADLREGDMATSVAEDIVGMVREYAADPQTLWQAMSEQFPKVKFTLDWYDAASLIAAEIRVERIVGVYEGLRLAGVIEPTEL